jgi:quercetin dioxygenase-like cupin family protein
MKNQERFLRPTRAVSFEQFAGLKTTLLTGMNGEQIMIALNATMPGVTVPMHSHSSEQYGVVYAGEGILRIGEEERTMRSGDFYHIPPEVRHGDTCIGDLPFVMLDIFSPVREDLLERGISALLLDHFQPGAEGPKV